MIPIIPINETRQRKRQHSKGRQTDPQALDEVRQLLGDASRQKDLLIEHLHKINDHFGHLPVQHLVALAQEMRLAQTEIFEVASFYHHFDIRFEEDSQAKVLKLRLCDGLSCQMNGAQDLISKLGLQYQNNEVQVERVPCIGRCEEAPAACFGQHEIPRASFESVTAKVGQGLHKPREEPYIDFDHYQTNNGYQILKDCYAGKTNKESLLKLMEDSGLRGLGGAGFPAGRKWRLVSAEPGPRLMAVNIDEGEPGTFKDRTYLERDPHRFLEGMLIAAWVVGISEIYIYLRDEYHACRQLLEIELEKLRISPPVPEIPSIQLRRGAGAYICGEESAMIESIEGKRGLPRLRPPYVAQVGLFGRPTLEHNFETLYWVPSLIQNGAEWFKQHGRNGRQGLRSFSVSGRVNKPGVHLAPAGISVRELIDEFAGGMQDGHELYAYLPGGASGGILPASLGHVPLDFDTLQAYGCFIGSAAVVILSQHDSAVMAARNTMNFFKHESCGQCAPCRAGTEKAVELIEHEQWNLELLSDLSAVMRDASICGLGQAAPNPIDCVIKYFPHELANKESIA
ncbi:NAD(P)H-dependent oxidoreductase subunit E [Undibacterium sp. LX40W]|uniref:NAD(P)H-dependent oxidoreductase subunit E n=1 Tax=Undibacterium nitidum TaxID=2762298 RepID=A0A923HRQ0_9BURK|nr:MULTISPECIES: NADH-ubiquinone oxidoreductase-F iron-sulfur binding region domain-containing protein [Undibacterium]MBC3881242.1 NAD(P)H-dependent oxidoreductase subunit E [Undibacterium nitidum]MBC3891975.1 NAD(P)H-dependent oxidoreductase subunit E [Undibacterium sp. LX40W]